MVLVTTHSHPEPRWQGKVSPIQAAEYAARREKLTEQAAAGGADVEVRWGHRRRFYLCGVASAPPERPIGLVIGPEGASVLFVPRLELEHAEAYAHVDRVVTYP